MANIKTRLKLRYDSLENWASKNPTLLDGEVAIAYLPPKGNGEAPAAVSTAVLMKAGPGEFNSLPFTSALAADVYGWAKQSENDFVNTFLTLKMTDGTTMQSKLDAVFATGEELAGAISGLKGEITTTLADYYTKEEVDGLFTTLREEIALPEGGFASKSDFDALKGKVEDEDGALAKANDAYALAGTKSTVTASATNGKLGLDGSDITVYDDTALAGRVSTLEGKTDLGDFTNNAGYAVAETVNAAIDLKADKSVVDAMYTNAKIDELLATKQDTIPAETYDAYGSAAAAEAAAKKYADDKFTDANLSQYTTEQEVKDIVDGVISAAADVETTLTGLTELVDYIEKHGGDASAMATDIGTLKGKVEVIEKKPAYEISATDISNWNGEIGAKAAIDGYTTAHANDYTNTQIDSAIATAKSGAEKTASDALDAAKVVISKEIDDDVKAAIDAEVERANGAYKTKQESKSYTRQNGSNIFAAISQDENGIISVEYQSVEPGDIGAAWANILDHLDANFNATLGAGKTFKTFIQEDGVLVAETQDIAITHSQVTDFDASVKAIKVDAATAADTATKATQDADGNVISETYAKTASLGALAAKDKVASTDFADEVFIFDCGNASGWEV